MRFAACQLTPVNTLRTPSTCQRFKQVECLKDGDRKGVTEEGVKDFVEQTVQDQLFRSESRKYMKRPEAITELQYW